MRNFTKLWGRPEFEAERIDWLFAHFGWLLANFGGYKSFLRSYHLVMTTPNDFPSVSLTSPENVERIFRAVMGHMGMGDWAVDLRQMNDEDVPSDFASDTSGMSMGYSADGLAGFFDHDSFGRVTIGYNPHLVSDFPGLISVFSHEAAHYLLTKSITVMPGGWADLEPVTDLTAIFTGFGIFQANTASVIERNSEGHRSSLSGYLPESGRAYALAVFSELSLLDPKFVAKHLRANPRASYRAAIDDIRKSRWKEMAELQTLTPLRDW